MLKRGCCIEKEERPLNLDIQMGGKMQVCCNGRETLNKAIRGENVSKQKEKNQGKIGTDSSQKKENRRTLKGKCGDYYTD